MIWHYFPIGMRFPVTDFSDETKRACWQIALSAIYASDPKGTGLYEACDPFDPVSGSPVYTCIVCYFGVKQSRPAGKTMHALSRLTARLCLYHPLVQANYLEAFGPYPLLGSIDETGALVPEPDGAAFLSTEAVIPMPVSDGPELLIAFADENGDPERLTRTLGTAAADRGFCVKRIPLPTGNRGAVQALLDACGGRYEALTCEDRNGERVKRTVAILPGFETVIEADGSVSTAQMIQKALDLGCRRITVLGGEAADAPEDERLAETALTFLPDGEAWTVHRIGLVDAAKTAAHIVTNRLALFGGDPRVIAATDADSFLKVLQGLGKGVANAPGL